mgnify:CR=1 FL=1
MEKTIAINGAPRELGARARGGDGQCHGNRASGQGVLTRDHDSGVDLASLPACKDCTYKAEHSGTERGGPRPGTTLPETAVGAPDVPLPVLLDLDETDVTATVRVRREQSHLRKHLFAGETERKCALCGRLLPSSLLVAAHIVPRRNLDDAQRLAVHEQEVVRVAGMLRHFAHRTPAPRTGTGPRPHPHCDPPPRSRSRTHPLGRPRLERADRQAQLLGAALDRAGPAGQAAADEAVHPVDH